MLTTNHSAVSSAGPGPSPRPDSASILLINEWGDGLGHAQRLRSLATVLVHQGHAVTIALGGLGYRWAVRCPALPGITWMPLPGQAPSAAVSAPWPCSFGEMLAAAGWDHADRLRASLVEIDSLLTAVAPRLVIADYAPTTLFACAGRAPALWIGNGFTVPPPVAGDFPRFWRPLEARWRIDSRPVAPLLGLLRAERGGPPAPDLASAFAHAEQFPFCSSALDLFSRLRPGPVFGPLDGYSPQISSADHRTVFAYLPGHHPRLPALLAGLIHSKLPAWLYCPELPPGLAAALPAPIRLLDRPLELPRLLSAFSTLFSAGGSLMEDAIGAGLTQVVASMHIDGQLRAEAAERTGTTHHYPLLADASPTAIATSLRWAVEDNAARARARELAHDLRTRFPRPGREALLARTAALLSG